MRKSRSDQGQSPEVGQKSSTNARSLLVALCTPSWSLHPLPQMLVCPGLPSWAFDQDSAPHRLRDLSQLPIPMSLPLPRGTKGLP